jgi:site-specific DNA-methyltransferase (adenine-specific)
MIVELLQGDCLELMEDIPDKSIDMVLCDPPYGSIACKWDIVIPFEPLWKQYKRIIKDRGAIVLFGSEPFSSLLRCSNLTMYKYDWVWKKSKYGNFILSKYQPIKEHENISIFSTGTASFTVNNNGICYYPQMWGEAIARNIGQDKDTTLKHQNGKMKTGYIIKSTNATGKRFPLSIIDIKSEGKTIHPTQKPVALLEYLIKTYTLEGETVLDNTMGSGSTGVACLNTNRSFIGMELNKDTFEIAKNRIYSHRDSK